MGYLYEIIEAFLRLKSIKDNSVVGPEYFFNRCYYGRFPRILIQVLILRDAFCHILPKLQWNSDVDLIGFIYKPNFWGLDILD